MSVFQANAFEVRWWQVLQPAIYLISILPALTVFSWQKSHNDIQCLTLVLATGGVVLLQHAINVFNDIIDGKRGTDAEKTLSWLNYHSGNQAKARIHGLLSLFLGLVMGIFALVLANRIEILLLATPMLLLGFLYNEGRIPLSYTRFSEWVTGIVYGPGVFGSLALLNSKSVDLKWCLGSIAYGCLASAILLSHQPRQVFTDGVHKKNTFAVRHGVKATLITSRTLSLIALFLLAFGSFNNGLTLTQNLLLFAVTGLAAFSVLINRITPPLVLCVTGGAILFQWGLFL